jgi:hypothetical protein
MKVRKQHMNRNRTKEEEDDGDVAERMKKKKTTMVKKGSDKRDFWFPRKLKFQRERRTSFCFVSIF